MKKIALFVIAGFIVLALAYIAPVSAYYQTSAASACRTAPSDATCSGQNPYKISDCPASIVAEVYFAHSQAELEVKYSSVCKSAWSVLKTTTAHMHSIFSTITRLSDGLEEQGNHTTGDLAHSPMVYLPDSGVGAYGAVIDFTASREYHVSLEMEAA